MRTVFRTPTTLPASPGATRRRAAAAGLACGLALVSAPLAAAHDAVVGGSPADGEVVADFPDTLTLEFSGQVQDGFNTFALSRADTGDVVLSGEPTVAGQSVSLDVPGNVDPEPGEYTLGFQIISSDGHATKGMTSFTYAPAEETGQPATASQQDEAQQEQQQQEEQPGRNLTWLWALIGVLVVGVAAAAAIARTGRK